MTVPERTALVGLLRERSFRKGESPLRAGTPSSDLLLVFAGQLTLRLEQGASTLDLGRVSPGRWVGELGLLRPGPAPVSALADEDTTVLQLEGAALAGFAK